MIESFALGNNFHDGIMSSDCNHVLFDVCCDPTARLSQLSSDIIGTWPEITADEGKYGTALMKPNDGSKRYFYGIFCHSQHCPVDWSVDTQMDAVKAIESIETNQLLGLYIHGIAVASHPARIKLPWILDSLAKCKKRLCLFLPYEIP